MILEGKLNIEKISCKVSLTNEIKEKLMLMMLKMHFKLLITMRKAMHQGTCNICCLSKILKSLLSSKIMYLESLPKKLQK